MGKLDDFFFLDRDVFQMFVFWWEMNGLTNQRLVLVCTFIVCEPCSKRWLVVFIYIYIYIYIWGTMLPSYMEIIISHWAIVRTPINQLV